MQNSEFLRLRKKIIESDFGSLNSMQKEAVFSTEGPLLVLAGAGSGKTTVLVNRIANMVKYGCAYYDYFVPAGVTDETVAAMQSYLDGDVTRYPSFSRFLSVLPVNAWNVLAITFTNKAAGELKERLAKKLNEEGEQIWASTFHSACVRILRRNAEKLGFSSNFTIYDTDDSKKVIKSCMKDLGISDKILNIKSVLSAISFAKNAFISPEEYIKENTSDVMKSNIGNIYRAYQNSLKNSDAMDFDDLIVNTVLLFRENRDVLDYYQNKFRYILIDEYQDTNRIQYILVSMLADKHKNICVVGDDDQSIYRFRGATVENILSFESQYQNAKIIRLEQNYRSTQNILDAANAVISNNQKRKGKNLWTDKGPGSKIIYHLAQTDIEEGHFIADKILDGIKNGKKYSDFAVLYRMNSQSNLVEQALVRSSIPYRIIGGHKFYDRKEIKDALAYLSVIVNPNDYVRLSRIINEPKRGIGDATMTAVGEIAAGLGIGVFDVIKTADEYPMLSRRAKRLKEFASMLESLIEYAQEESPSEVFKQMLLKTDYQSALDAEPEKKADRLENLDQLLNNIVTFEQTNEDADINDFLQEVSLMTDIDSYNSEADCVVLMTVHAAKGLEFPTVFIAGFEDTIFPSDLAIQEGGEGIEEERRLAYVGITRAKEQLIISSCRSRIFFGQTRFNKVSRFFGEIPNDIVELSRENRVRMIRQRGKSDFISPNIWGEPQSQSKKSKSAERGFSGLSKTSSGSSASVVYRVGDTVVHKAFGTGIVISSVPMGSDTMLEVAFESTGTKKMMANFAKLEKK
ncbi:MAG: UvrD-helicase domain-containing protein [Clostridiales bacterium]|nr:UvrD-helicase domain-containing protein [Clostridiales bacterium]